MKSIPHLQHILNDECSHLLEVLPNTHEKLQILSDKNQKQFREKVVALGCDISSSDASACAHNKMIALIEEIERTLKNIFPLVDPSSADALLTFGHSLLDSIPHNPIATKYLTDTAIKRLLVANPPHALLKLHHADNIENLSKKLSLRMILSATRHTEDDAWQHAYQSSLSACTAADFEDRELALQVLDMQQYSQTLNNAGRTLKPWRVSHSKEAGVITFFTADKNVSATAPLLTRATVFLHYYFEVIYAGKFVAESSNTNASEPIGTKLVSVIRNHRDSFAHFTTPNVYDENLYWQHALIAFDSIFNIPAFSFFKDATSLGGRCADTDDLLSLHIIDVLWDISLSNTAITAYFGNDQKRFLYHMQESLWYDLLQDLLDIAPEDMEKLVTASLDIGDVTFTKNLIQSKIQALG